VYDEETGEWVPRWGYKGANKKMEDQWLVELPNNPKEREEDLENPRTALKNDRKARIKANEGRQLKNLGEKVPAVKKSSAKDVITKKLAQRLRKSKVGKALGGRMGRRG
jgi:Ribosome biogenesis regulatory protein (RRS1)